MVTIPRRGCPVCGFRSAEVIHTQHFAESSISNLPSHYNVVCCVICGMVYSDMESSQEQFDSYYAKYASYAKTSSSVFDDANNESIAAFIDCLNVKHDATILDIGCGSGTLFYSLKEHGYTNLRGIEPSQSCCDIVRAKGFACNAGSIASPYFKTNAILHENKCDLIILSSALEHIYNVELAIENILSMLSENGKLVIEVPDACRYHSHSPSPFFFFDQEHINHFGMHSLVNLAHKYSLFPMASQEKDFNKNGFMYPNLIVSFTRSFPNAIRTYDYTSRISADKHTKTSDTDYQKLEYKLSEIQRLDMPVHIFGAGQATLKLLPRISAMGLNIISIIDNNKSKHGGYIGRYSIISPESAVITPSDVILVSSPTHEKDIVSQLRDDMKLTNCIVSI